MSILDNVNKVHFVGIGGVSMNSLALCLSDLGYEVTGSDLNESPTVEKLRRHGIKITVPHGADCVGDAQLVVYTAAVDFTNPELAYAKEHGIPAAERAVLLGHVMKKYRLPIGIAGTHGKTTVTSMISSILLKAGTDPTIMVGGELPVISGTLRLGKGDPFIFESCEYHNSFLNFYPKISVITNIEADHLDFFKDINDIINSFTKYCANTLPGGTLVVNGEDENVMKTVKNQISRTVTFGLKSGDYHAENITVEGGLPSFDLVSHGDVLGRIKLSVFGEYNIKNAIAAAAACLVVGVSFECIRKGLESFHGTKRRMEFKKTFHGASVFDDYAHHPTEIAASVSAARQFTEGKLLVVFQPHTYSRTKFLCNDFALALSKSDKVIFADIYAAREKSIPGITSEIISRLVPGSECISDFKEIALTIEKAVSKGDTVLLMGAGDIYKLSALLKND